MPQDRTPTAPVPWDEMERLAAGELGPEAAAALRARIDADDTWAAACAQVVATQDALDAEPLHPMPLTLVRGVMDRVAAPTTTRFRWPHIAAGWAAAILLTLAAWVAVSGEAPGLATAAPPATWIASAESPGWLVEGDRDAWQPRLVLHGVVPHPDRELAWPWIVGGLLLLGFGVHNALRMHRRAARSGGGA